ncbi:hypothetical protein HYW66_01495 [Candidatus Microgenomates bacterium]|nr:hypothetical protein [Candidatus Microgenomates bacterium]
MALNTAGLLLLLAVVATGGFAATKDSIYARQVGQQIGGLIQPALQAFTDATQAVGQQITSGPTAPPK